MSTNRTRRQRTIQKPTVPSALIYYFQTGDQDQSGFDEIDHYNEFLPDFDAGMGRDIIDYWRACRDEVVAGWIRKHAGSRPFAWWRFDAPEPLREGESEAAFLERHNLLTVMEKRTRKR